MTEADRDHRVVQLLACIPRGRADREGRHEEEHRVALCEYNGNAYISTRVFWLAQDGNYYPGKKGDTIRLGEAEEVAAAILEGLRIAREQRPAARPATPARRPFQQPAASPAPRETATSAPREVQKDAFDDLAEFRRKAR
jgi:Transcriptional Coactivator p15 (PC4)